MAGNLQGGIKAAETNKRLYGADFYRELGRKGGRNSHNGGFYANRELASIAGRKGGSISRRGKRKIEVKPIPKQSFLQRLFGGIRRK